MSVEASRRPALVVVDVQNGFVNGNSSDAIPGIRQLLNYWRRSGDPIYLTKFLNLEGSKWETLIGWERLRDEPETSLHPSIIPYLGDATLIEKKNLYSSITGKLREDLDARRLGPVYICGIATESCVLATALSVFEFEDRRNPLCCLQRVSKSCWTRGSRDG